MMWVYIVATIIGIIIQYWVITSILKLKSRVKRLEKETKLGYQLREESE